MGLHIGYKCKCQQNLVTRERLRRAAIENRMLSEIPGSGPRIQSTGTT